MSYKFRCLYKYLEELLFRYQCLCLLYHAKHKEYFLNQKKSTNIFKTIGSNRNHQNITKWIISQVSKENYPNGSHSE